MKITANREHTGNAKYESKTRTKRVVSFTRRVPKIFFRSRRSFHFYAFINLLFFYSDIFTAGT